jgi:hypothetical protein
MYGLPDEAFRLTGGSRIHIGEFDLQAKKASIKVEISTGAGMGNFNPGVVIGDAHAGGEGWIVYPDGRVVPIPPQRQDIIQALNGLGFDG